MRKMAIWAELTLKRLFQKKGFLALLLALPLLGFFAGYWEANHTRGVEVGLLRSSDPVADSAIRELLEVDGLFEYRVYEEEGALIDAVKNRVLESAFIFDPRLSERLGKKEVRDLIRLVRSPSTVTHGMAAEIVFSEMLDAASPNIISDVVRESGLFSGKEAAVSEQIVGRYAHYDTQGGTYRFTYEYLDGAPAEQTGIPLFPTKGLLAIFIMLTAWINVLNWYKDEEEGIYGAFPVLDKKIAGFLSVWLPVLVMTLTGLVLLLTRYPLGQALAEFFYLLCYGLALSLFLYGCKFFFRSPVAYGVLMPMVLLGSLVASPVILDMGSLIPNLKILEKLFFPSYYLALSSGLQLWAAAGLAAMAAAGVVLIYFEDRKSYAA